MQYDEMYIWYENMELHAIWNWNVYEIWNVYAIQNSQPSVPWYLFLTKVTISLTFQNFLLVGSSISSKSGCEKKKLKTSVWIIIKYKLNRYLRKETRTKNLQKRPTSIIATKLVARNSEKSVTSYFSSITSL